MKLDDDICYKIIQSNDARFDGVFFVGVESTGIYCRPVCKVPAPKKENCKYYSSAAKAEEEGFRPCLRCRPEMAPNYSEFSQEHELLRMLLEYFEQHNFYTGVIGEASDYFGVSSRHINRIFHEVLGVGPRDYMMTKRLLRGKALLTDTNLSITDVSELSGFGSPSRFSAAFKEHYRLTPTSIRKQKKATADFISMQLAYRPPYNWDLMMNFLRVRAIPHVEHVTDKGIYRRSLQIEEKGIVHSGWLEVKPLEDECKIAIKVSNSLDKVIITVVQKVRKVFDLDADPNQFPEILDDGVRLPGCFDSFEMSTRAILGQQVTVKAATTLSGRVAEAIGADAMTPWKEIDRYFPTIKEIEGIEEIGNVLGQLGIIRSRSETIYCLAKEIAEGEISFGKEQNMDDLRKKLLKIKGIGPWSVEYLLMRGSSWPDAFPVSDLVIKQRLMNHLFDGNGERLSEGTDKYTKYILNKKYEKAALEWAEQYRPWRSYMTIGLWNNLVDWS